MSVQLGLVRKYELESQSSKYLMVRLLLILEKGVEKAKSSRRKGFAGIALTAFLFSIGAIGAHVNGQQVFCLASNPLEAIEAYPLQHPIVIDGKYNMTLIKGAGNIMVDEWNQTRMKPMYTLYPESVRNGTGFIGLAYDKDNYYVLWDFTSCKTKLSINNGAVIVIGQSHHNRTSPSSDDFSLSLNWVPTISNNLIANVMRWTGNAWQGSHMTQGYQGIYFASDLGPSPNSPEPHLIFEAKIPLSMIVKNTASPIGMCAFMTEWISMKERIALSYPYDTDSRVPNKWADLKIMSVPIPEFPNPNAVTLATSLSSIFLKRRRHRQFVRA